MLAALQELNVEHTRQGSRVEYVGRVKVVVVQRATQMNDLWLLTGRLHVLQQVAETTVLPDHVSLWLSKRMQPLWTDKGSAYYKSALWDVLIATGAPRQSPRTVLRKVYSAEYSLCVQEWLIRCGHPGPERVNRKPAVADRMQEFKVWKPVNRQEAGVEPQSTNVADTLYVHSHTADATEVDAAHEQQITHPRQAPRHPEADDHGVPTIGEKGQSLRPNGHPS
jgi:hypothetical protein